MLEADRLQRMVMLARIRKDMEARWKWTRLHPNNKLTTFLAYSPDREHKLYSSSEYDAAVGHATFLGWGKLGVWRPSEYETELKTCMTDPIIVECIALRQINGETHYTLYSKSIPIYGTISSAFRLAVIEDSCQYIYRLFEESIEIFNSLSTVK